MSNKTTLQRSIKLGQPVVLTGAPRTGKTELVKEVLDEMGLVQGEDYLVVKGNMSPVMLYMALAAVNETGKLVVVDDLDSDLLNDEDGSRLLKGAMDTTPKVSWLTKSFVKSLIDDKALPKEFDVKCNVLVTTNISRGLQFDALCARSTVIRM